MPKKCEMSNSANLDQTALKEQSSLGLHSLPRLFTDCPNIVKDKYFSSHLARTPY